MDTKESTSRSHNDPPSTGPALPVRMFNVGKQTVFCRIDRPKCQGNAFCLYNVYNHISWFLYHYPHVGHHRSAISCLKGLGNRPSCPVEGLCTIQLIVSVNPKIFDQQIETKCKVSVWSLAHTVTIPLSWTWFNPDTCLALHWIIGNIR